jgi:cell division protease FtsH
MQHPTEDRFLLARSDLENRIAVLMGGRAAETLIYDENVSTGAADDLQRATEVALEMVTRHGMDDIVGQRTYAPPPLAFLPGPSADRIQAAETTAREIDLGVRDIITHAFGRAAEILKSRRADLEKGAELLLLRETLSAEDFPPIRPAASRLKTGDTSAESNTAMNGGQIDAGLVLLEQVPLEIFGLARHSRLSPFLIRKVESLKAHRPRCAGTAEYRGKTPAPR